MLLALIAVLLLLWLLGMVLSLTFGGLLHLLLIAAAILMFVQVIRGS